VTSDSQDSQPSDTNGSAPDGEEKAAESSRPADTGAAELEALKAERDRFRDQWMRAAADFENFRKRTKRDLDDAKARGRDDVIRELLPVFDNLDRAVQSSEVATDVKSVIDGVKMVLKMFEDTSKNIGLVRVKTVGERFDPNAHEALQQVESPDHAPGTIVSEIAAGYRVGERLVRPAMVVVARKAAEPKPVAKPEAAGSADPAAGTAVDKTTTDAPQSAGDASPKPAEPSGSSGSDKPE
jgi:molecular chaperone GrpE